MTLSSNSRGESSLADTVKPYSSHFFACTGSVAWPARIEEAGGLLGRMALDVRAAGENLDCPPKLTATDEPSHGNGFDLLAFPIGVRYHDVDETSWPMILDDAVNKHRGPSAVPHTLLEGTHVFVCTHGSRDDRCGQCGPAIVSALRRACRDAELDDVSVRATSHVGGHKFAGNVLIYPDGVWYGHVRPEDASRIAIEHIRDRTVIAELLRGRIQPA
ncbi:MAG: sucrase ferredoxin [Gemmatimonadetes bacterium]|nr:sucrase ferredoxin [Gemmatimonadota bacterium]